LSSIDIELLKNYANHIKQIGLNFISKELYDKAQKKFEVFIRIANKIGGPLMMAEGKQCIALLEHKKGNFNRALQILEMSLEIVNKHGSKIEKLPILESMAKVYTDQEKY
jgi:tetratricopeptide (TPR) repeat protein